MKGVTSMVFSLSLRFSRALEAIMAGTVHPKPRSMGMKALPESPSLPMIPSIT